MSTVAKLLLFGSSPHWVDVILPDHGRRIVERGSPISHVTKQKAPFKKGGDMVSTGIVEPAAAGRATR